MLCTARDIEDCTIGATDGTLGKVADCYFDDDAWVVRFLVVETGGWLAGKKALIPHNAVGRPDWNRRVLPVSITRSQVANSPHVDTERPVSRQQERSHLDHYGIPYYWDDGALPGAQEDPRLRSANVAMKYHVHASDGDIGYVRGLFIDDRSWAIRFMIVDTGTWLEGHRVLIAPEWIDEVNLAADAVTVDLSRKAVEDSAVYDSNMGFTMAQDLGIYRQDASVMGPVAR